SGHATHQVIHDIGGTWVDGASRCITGDNRLGLHDDLAATVGDVVNQIRRNAVTSIGKDRIGPGQLQRCNAAGTERQRQYGWLAGPVKAEAGDVVLHVLGTD